MFGIKIKFDKNTLIVMIKRDNIANLLNQQILLEELEKKEGKKIEEENNKSKILLFILNPCEFCF